MEGVWWKGQFAERRTVVRKHIFTDVGIDFVVVHVFLVCAIPTRVPEEDGRTLRVFQAPFVGKAGRRIFNFSWDGGELFRSVGKGSKIFSSRESMQRWITSIFCARGPPSGIYRLGGHSSARLCVCWGWGLRTTCCYSHGRSAFAQSYRPPPHRPSPRQHLTRGHGGKSLIRWA